MSEFKSVFDKDVSLDFDNALEASRRDWLLPMPRDGSHAPFFLPLTKSSKRKQTLLLAMFTGGEGKSGCGIAVARFEADKWSKSKLVTSNKGESHQNPVLFQMQKKDNSDGGDVVLLHTAQDAGPLGVMQKTSEVRALRSTDGGKSFGKPTVLMQRGVGAFIRGRVVPVQGALALPMYYTPGGEFDTDAQCAAVRFSTDGGVTFPVDSQAIIPGSQGAIGVQPVLVRGVDGKRLIAFMRCRVRNEDGSRYIMRSVSDDEGRTWSEIEPTPLLNNNSSIDALRLPNGWIVVAYNDHVIQRWPLAIALSIDDGKTFVRRRLIVPGHEKTSPTAHSMGLNGEFSYATLAFEAAGSASKNADDGFVHIAFTFGRGEVCGHSRVSVNWLIEKHDELP